MGPGAEILLIFSVFSRGEDVFTKTERERRRIDDACVRSVEILNDGRKYFPTSTLFNG